MSACGASYEPLDGWWPSSKKSTAEARKPTGIKATGTEAHMEYYGGFVVLGHALEHSMRGHGRRVPKPHYPS